MQSDRAGLLEGRGGADGQEIVNFANGLRRARRSENPAHAPSGDTVGFREAIDDDGAVAHAVDGGHGHVLCAVVKNVLVDFVCDAVGVPADAKVADKFEFRAGENFAGGIVRRIQNDGFGVGTEGAGEFFFVKRPVGRAELDESRSGATQNRVGTVIFVEGLKHDDFIAGIDDRHHGGHHGFRRAAADGNFAFGIVAHALSAGKFFDHGIAQGLRAPSNRVLIDVVRSGKIGKTLRQIHGVMLHGQARHFANHGFRELLGFGREHTARDLSHGGIRGCHCTFLLHPA